MANALTLRDFDACDERFGDVLVASPADAGGRGISLAIRQNGTAVDLTSATVYFVWKHKVTGERGTEPFTATDASGGKFEVYYPAAMQETEGAVQAQVMVSRGDDTYISSRVFTIRVEPVVIGGEEHADGFTLFVDAINAYEHATEVTTDAADAANAAAALANTARENLTAAAERGEPPLTEEELPTEPDDLVSEWWNYYNHALRDLSRKHDADVVPERGVAMWY